MYILFFSPMNFGCCSEACQPASRSHVCRPALEGSCLGEIKCKYPFIVKEIHLSHGQECSGSLILGVVG